ncbi:MAG: prepilin-type N-terminal cleavage/methylation domain-containing protein [Candidatus Omnitrophota bacterium]|jgi:prepilin-type N-terminal cleavage/methylation domain-containing protein
MNRKGFTLVEIMVIVAIIALLAAIIVPNFLNSRLASNTETAKVNILSLSKACETYSTVNNGVYPDSVAKLATFISVAKSYCANETGGITSVQGYNYKCSLGAGGYTLEASPVKAGITGSAAYTVTTGGALKSS